MMIRAAAVLALALGCGNKTDPQQCRSDAYDLQQLLRSVDHDPSVAITPITLVSRPELQKLGSKVESVVEIRGDIRVHGKLVSPSELHDELAQMHEWEPRRGPIIFAIDSAARWDVIAGAISTAASAGVYKITLAFEAKPSVIAPPPRTPIDDKLDAIDNNAASEKATEVAKMLTGIIGSCSSLKKGFGYVGADEGDRTGEVIAMLGPALTECNCNVDMPALRSLMFRVVTNKHPATGLAVELSDHATPIAFPAETTWAEASKKLGSDTTQVTIAVVP